jgi:hypothetical protein
LPSPLLKLLGFESRAARRLWRLFLIARSGLSIAART